MYLTYLVPLCDPREIRKYKQQQQQQQNKVKICTSKQAQSHILTYCTDSTNITTAIISQKAELIAGAVSRNPKATCPCGATVCIASSHTRT